MVCLHEGVGVGLVVGLATSLDAVPTPIPTDGP